MFGFTTAETWILLGVVAVGIWAIYAAVRSRPENQASDADIYLRHLNAEAAKAQEAATQRALQVRAAAVQRARQQTAPKAGRDTRAAPANDRNTVDRPTRG